MIFEISYIECYFNRICWFILYFNNSIAMIMTADIAIKLINIDHPTFLRVLKIFDENEIKLETSKLQKSYINLQSWIKSDLALPLFKVFNISYQNTTNTRHSAAPKTYRNSKPNPNQISTNGVTIKLFHRVMEQLSFCYCAAVSYSAFWCHVLQQKIVVGSWDNVARRVLFLLVWVRSFYLWR